MRSKRISEIEDYIYENKTVTLDQLCRVFDVSKNTIRRDLKEIISDGNFKKIYGGITVKDNKICCHSAKEISATWMERKK